MSPEFNSERLAIEGGDAVIPDGPPCWPPRMPLVEQAIGAAVADHEWGVYRGRHTNALIELLRRRFGYEHVQLAASGTIAVELALRGLSVGVRDEVLLAGYDFPGNFRAIEMTGARPVLVDLAPQSWTIDLSALMDAASAQTKAVIVSHLHSETVPMASLADWARSRGVAIVEDACQCPGAEVDGRPCGQWGDVAVFSFGGSKLLTSGRGGCLLIRDAGVAQRIHVYRERGNDAYPLSQLQAAALVPQWAALDEWNRRRWHRAQQLEERLQAMGWFAEEGLFEVRSRPLNEQGAYYKLPWMLRERFRNDRDSISAALRGEGLAVDAGFRGFHKRSSRRCRRSGELTHSRDAAERTLILHHPLLLQSESMIERAAAAFHKVAIHFAGR